MEQAEKILTTVKIFGGEYRLRSPDAEYGLMIARFVDDRMKEVADRQRITSPTQVAILTLLNLADELFRERERLDGLGGAIEARVAELDTTLEGAMAAEQGDGAAAEATSGAGSQPVAGSPRS